jgi:acylphosphatase
MGGAERVRKRVIVAGDVQGVFFRDSCRRQAESAGVGGWVTNRPDGRVEACFEGDPEAVEAMLDWCRQGPSQADVRDLDVTDEEPRGETDFRVR